MVCSDENRNTAWNALENTTKVFFQHITRCVVCVGAQFIINTIKRVICDMHSHCQQTQKKSTSFASKCYLMVWDRWFSFHSCGYRISICCAEGHLPLFSQKQFGESLVLFRAADPLLRDAQYQTHSRHHFTNKYYNTHTHNKFYVPNFFPFTLTCWSNLCDKRKSEALKMTQEWAEWVKYD